MIGTELNYQLIQASDRAIMIRIIAPDLLSANSCVVAFHQFLSAKKNTALKWINRLQPAFDTLLIAFDLRAIAFEAVETEIHSQMNLFLKDKIATSASVDATIRFNDVGATVEIPVCYDSELAPDLENYLSHSQLTLEELIHLHSERSYRVYFIGFMPGFPYLGDLNPRLAMPRKSTSDKKVPAGSIAIGGSQTGVYPIESPGGWHIIGRTPKLLFDLHRTPAFLLKAGDQVKFIPISKYDFLREKSKWEQ